VKHIDFTEPYNDELRNKLLAAAKSQRRGRHRRPRSMLQPRAETGRRLRKSTGWNGTAPTSSADRDARGDPAREIELAYAAIAVVVNHARGRGASARALRCKKSKRC